MTYMLPVVCSFTANNQLIMFVISTIKSRSEKKFWNKSITIVKRFCRHFTLYLWW